MSTVIAKEKHAGLAVDSSGGPVVDPTANVLSLVEAANKRQDDLRAAESRRIDDLRTAESRRLDEQADMRAEFQDKLSAAEKSRIDAIRAVDVNAVAVASQRASDQASVLANQVVQSAEALRVLVASTAATVATSQQQLATTLSARLTTLEQAQYEGKGKQAYSDPMMVELVSEMKSMRASRSENSGRSSGIGLAWSAMMAVGLLLAAAVGAVAAVLALRH